MSFVTIAITRNFVSTACSACGPNGNATAIYAAMTAEEVATLSRAATHLGTDVFEVRRAFKGATVFT